MSESNKDVAQDIAKLVWEEKGEKKEFILDKATKVSIGRDKSQDITLPDQKVSKLHTIVSWNENRFVVTDQKSSNGTFVNGTQIKNPTDLKGGDKITIGAITFSFVAASTAQVAELKTRIFPRVSDEAEAGKPQMPKDALEHMETGIFEEVPPKKVEPAPSKAMGEGLKEISDIVDGLSGLIEQVNVTRETIEKLRDEQEKTKVRMVSTVSKLDSVAKELEKVVKQSVELNNQVKDSEFIKLLAELSKKSSDVNLLVELAGHAELISDLAKLISTQATKLDELRQLLNNELANFKNT